jgi:pectate lyase
MVPVVWATILSGCRDGGGNEGDGDDQGDPAVEDIAHDDLQVEDTAVEDGEDGAEDTVDDDAEGIEPEETLAFPGAQGSGVGTPGGRGECAGESCTGSVCRVTTLEDTEDPGSLRSCINQAGPRILVFAVSGTIVMNDDLPTLTIENPYITIAGQTAPGDGIQLSGTSLPAKDNLAVSTHDVVIRYLRSRHGDAGGVGDQIGQPIEIAPCSACEIYNLVVDHCSLAWSQDENIGIWSNNLEDGPDMVPRDMTYSWNIAAEALFGHPTNVLTGSDYSILADGQTDIDFHHNFFTNSSYRNPLLKNRSSRIVNNVIYNWDIFATETVGGVEADIIANVYTYGPDSSGSAEIQAYANRNDCHDGTPDGSGTDTCPVETCGGYCDHASGHPSLYVTGNMGPNDPDPTPDSNWAAMVRECGGEGGGEIGALPDEYRRSPWAPLPAPASGVDIVPDPAAGLDEALLALVGASRRIDCFGAWVFNRDSTDLRLATEYVDGTGQYPVSETDVGGFPEIRQIEAGATCAPDAADNSDCSCSDGDEDGMPDPWESAWGLDPADPADAFRTDRWNDGYANIEHFINGMNPAAP